jgi:hypothetical protein
MQNLINEGKEVTVLWSRREHFRKLNRVGNEWYRNYDTNHRYFIGFLFNIAELLETSPRTMPALDRSR